MLPFSNAQKQIFRWCDTIWLKYYTSQLPLQIGTAMTIKFWPMSWKQKCTRHFQEVSLKGRECRQLEWLSRLSVVPWTRSPLDSWSRHMSGLQPGSPVGGTQEASYWCFSLSFSQSIKKQTNTHTHFKKRESVRFFTFSTLQLGVGCEGWWSPWTTKMRATL